jgi:hypothetical protein
MRRNARITVKESGPRDHLCSFGDRGTVNSEQLRCDVASTRRDEGVGDIVGVLEGLGIRATEAPAGSGDTGFDAFLSVGERRIPVEVKGDVRDHDAEALVAGMPAHSLVVADRLSPRARALLDLHQINWLDRRGHLRLVLPSGIFIDRDIEPLLVEGRGRAADPFTRVGLDVAIALLLDPTDPPGVREISRRTGTSVGRVSELVRELKDQGLLNRDGSPAIPELFEAAADAWSPHWVALGATPQPDPTVRLGGLLAAIRQGVPLAVTEGWPPELYVHDEFALRRLVRTYPPSLESSILPAATVAVCPSPYGFGQTRGEKNLEFQVINHVVVALDLAQDKGRGRDALERWNPEGIVRVW